MDKCDVSSQPTTIYLTMMMTTMMIIVMTTMMMISYIMRKLVKRRDMLYREWSHTLEQAYGINLSDCFVSKSHRCMCGVALRFDDDDFT